MMIGLVFVIMILWTLTFILLDVSIKSSLQSSISNEDVHSDEVEVVAAFRNEEKNLPALLESLNALKFKGDSLKVTLINDHSDDDSVEVVNQLQHAYDRLKIQLLQSEGHGKKQALKHGLAMSKARWVVLTDADCSLPDSYLGEMIGQLKTEDKGVGFGPVSFSGHTLWQRLLEYDNLNTQIVSEAFLRLGKPLMVNGANMVLEGRMLPDYLKSLENDFVSGDDVFFAQSLGRQQFSFAYSGKTAVKSQSASTFSELFHQRVRWASKSAGYAAWWSRFVAAFFFALSLTFSLIYVSPLFGWLPWNWVVLTFLLKVVIESHFHSRWFVKYGYTPKWYMPLLMSAIHPFYMSLIGVVSLLPLKFKWKGRVMSAKI